MTAYGAAVFVPSSTESAVANGDTRTLHLFHTHTGETIDATFRVDGHYDPEVLRQLNHFLRDWRNDDEISMDPRLFDAVWEAYRTAGATDRIQIYSAYRSPETNAMLRRRSRAVAEHSQHMLGKAMDTTMPGFPMERIREAGMKLQHGGVGWYPSANFVHLDVGGVRSWPRMSYDQLASIFPDGKTVHIASDGRTLPGYDQARVELAQAGGIELPPEQQSPGFFAWLFGGGNAGSATAREDEEDRRAPASAGAPAAAPAPAATATAAVASVAPAAPAPQADPQAPALAYAPAAGAPATGAPAPQPADGQAAAAASPPAASSQVATLEPADVDRSIASDVALPMPPRRPVDLASDAPDVPLPPIRPDFLASIDQAPIDQAPIDQAPLRLADAEPAVAPNIPFVTSTASGVPMVRRSSLPPIITQGATHARSAGVALAFAAVEDQAPSLPAASSVEPQTGAPPRIEADADAASVVAGPKLTGLRKAVRLATENAAL